MSYQRQRDPHLATASRFTEAEPNMMGHMISMRVLDLTHAFGPGQPRDPEFEDEQRHREMTIERDDFDAVYHHIAGSWGTHVDAPAEMVAGGRTIDALPAEELVLPLIVLDISHAVAENPDSSLPPGRTVRHGHRPRNHRRRPRHVDHRRRPRLRDRGGERTPPIRLRGLRTRPRSLPGRATHQLARPTSDRCTHRGWRRQGATRHRLSGPRSGPGPLALPMEAECGAPGWRRDCRRCRCARLLGSRTCRATSPWSTA